MNDCNYNADGDYYFKLTNIDSVDFILGENCDRFCNVCLVFKLVLKSDEKCSARTTSTSH